MRAFDFGSLSHEFRATYANPFAGCLCGDLLHYVSRQVAAQVGRVLKVQIYQYTRDDLFAAWEPVYSYEEIFSAKT